MIMTQSPALKPFTACPYGASDCPKIEDLDAVIRSMEKRILRIEQLLYVICGILVAEFGIVII